MPFLFVDNYEVQISETLKKLERSEKAVKNLELSFGDLQGNKINLQNSLKQVIELG